MGRRVADPWTLERLMDWGRENARYGPAPTMLLPSAPGWLELGQGLQLYGKVIYAGGVDEPMMAYRGNPLTPNDWILLAEAKEARRRG